MLFLKVVSGTQSCYQHLWQVFQEKERSLVSLVTMNKIIGEGTVHRLTEMEQLTIKLVALETSVEIGRLLVKRTRYSNLVLWDHVMTSQLIFAKEELTVAVAAEAGAGEHSEESVNLIVAVAVIAGM